jgi:DNA helicase-2/ATP-dependent DNA helicase PcrA
MHELFEKLNPEQKEAVSTTDGPLLVLSGAGTGKTKVLTSRIANILLERKASPHQILAVTFTNKAANEMKERLLDMIGPPATGVFLGTFHSFGVRILRKYGKILDIDPSFIIITPDEQEKLIKELMLDRNIDIKKWDPKIMSSIINRWKDKGLIPGKPNPNLKGIHFANHNAPEIYKDYQSKLRQINAVDFGDLLLQPLILFAKHEDILESYQNRYKYILVDEYQDTNIAQYYLLRLLAQKEKNICCVGDDDQSIYSWRGAEVENILKFEKDFENAKIIRLETNYRSTKHILDAASKLINNNKERLGKFLRPSKDKIDAEKISLFETMDASQEAQRITEEIEALLSKGYYYSQIAVLVRANFLTRVIEEKFITNGIPYKIIGGVKFYERAEIKDILAYIRLTLQDTDDLAFTRIINTPKRSIGKTSINTIKDYANKNELTLYEASQKMLELNLLKPALSKSLTMFINLIENFKMKKEALEPHAFIKYIAQKSGYFEMLEQSKDIKDETRIENINELVNVVKMEFSAIEDFMEYVSLVMDIDEESGQDQVNIMTLHASKGLEFEAVFLPAWEEGIFPSQKSMEEEGEQGLEEERRLAYVGITRAKQKAFISYAISRMVFGSWQTNIPSRFIAELPEESLEIQKITNMSYSYKKPIPKKINNDPYSIGAKVFHEEFGYGRIVSKDGEKLQIAFENNGIKKLMANYIELA